jgi:hypothetical protein
MGIFGEIAMGLDRVTFARRAGFHPEPWQQRVLRSGASRILLNCTRQGGKSTTVATLACHTALFKPGSTTLIVSRAERQSAELLRKSVAMFNAHGRPTDPKAESKLALELDTGSRIIALPGSEASIRSYSHVDLLIFDEASKVVNATYESMRPVVAVGGGTVVALSTPFGTRGWWYEAWRSKGPQDEYWERYEVPATQCPHISPEFLAQERRRMGSWWYEQEYMCRFLDAQDAVFKQVDIDRMFAEDYETWELGV